MEQTDSNSSLDLGKAVSLAIANSKLKYKQVAEELDVSINYLYDVATNRKRPGLNFLINLSELCQIKLSALIQNSEH